MLRALVGGLLVAAIAIAIGLFWYRSEQALRQRQAGRIVDLTDQVNKLSGDNQQLKNALAKVQDEENRLVHDNEDLRKAFEQAKLTGKLPNALPYPPK